MSVLSRNKNMQDLIEDSVHSSQFNHQMAKWQAMCISINADLAKEIIRTNEVVRKDPNNKTAQKHQVYLEETFNKLHSEVVLLEDIFQQEIVKEDVANFYMISNAAMSSLSRSFAPKRLSDGSAPDKMVDWVQFLSKNRISKDRSDVKWVALGNDMLRRLDEELRQAFVRMDSLCHSILMVNNFMVKNADDLNVRGDRVVEVIDMLNTSERQDVDDRLNSRDLEQQISAALSIGENRRTNRPGEQSSQFSQFSRITDMSHGDDPSFTSSRFNITNQAAHQQDIDMRTIKTLGEYEEMKKRNGSMNMFKMKLERRLRQSKLEKRNLYIPFEDRRVDTTLLLEQTQDLLD